MLFVEFKGGYNNVVRKINYYLLTILVLLSLLISFAGCAPGSNNEGASTTTFPVVAAKERFRIATTTSLYDTGLWYYLEPMFERKYNVEMDIVYAGTGIALEYGRRGDVHAVVVHDRAAEDKFIANGYSINRRYFAYNYFLIAGPASDPAGIKDMSPEDAFKKLAAEGKKNPAKVKFVSRGDNSGTHSKEKLIWAAAGFKYEDIQKSGPWYIEAGKGMGPCLLMANEQGAYVLADISTFLAYKGKLNLVPLVEKGEIFLNVYAAMAINPDKVPTANLQMANNFINWLISDEIQKVIGTYGVTEYGRPLFNPTSGGGCKQQGCPTVDEYSKPVQ
jgi:tungstate transport system substrate-binding protein